MVSSFVRNFRVSFFFFFFSFFYLICCNPSEVCCLQSSNQITLQILIPKMHLQERLIMMQIWKFSCIKFSIRRVSSPEMIDFITFISPCLYSIFFSRTSYSFSLVYYYSLMHYASQFLLAKYLKINLAYCLSKYLNGYHKLK